MSDTPQEMKHDVLSIDEIMDGFSNYDGTYRYAEVEAAIARKEEIIPRFIEELEKVLENPEETAEDDTLFVHNYALMLLGFFGASKAHRVIIDLMRLPADLPHRLFGIIITENLPMILFRTQDGNYEAIRDLLHDPYAYSYCRAAAAEAMSYAVVEGLLPHDEVLSILVELLDEEETETNEYFHTLIVGVLCDICPIGVLDRIDRAYDEGLIDPFFVEREYWSARAMAGTEVCLATLKRDMEQRSLENIHQKMSWWHNFNTYTGPSQLPVVHTRQRKQKPQKKRKRKQSKQSRKRNR